MNVRNEDVQFAGLREVHAIVAQLRHQLHIRQCLQPLEQIVMQAQGFALRVLRITTSWVRR